MLIALTGAAGHIGAALVRRLLEEGHRVRVLIHRSGAALQGLPVERVGGSLEDSAALAQLCAGADVVQHLASRISIGEVPEAILRKTNVEGPARVLEACRQAGVRRMIHFSSVHAFHAVPWDREFDETAPPATAFPYERSKADAQALVLAANGKGGVETLCLNPTAVLGPWDFQPSLQGQMILDLLHGRIPMLTPGGFDWVDNRDIAQAALAAMTRGRAGEAYILPGRYATMLEFAAILGQIARRPMPTRAVPFGVLKAMTPLFVAWGRMTGRRPLFTREALSHVELGHPRVSGAKAARDLGYQPRPLEETLRDVVQWFETRS